MSELRKDGLTLIIFGIKGYYPVFCSRKPIIAGNIQNEKCNRFKNNQWTDPESRTFTTVLHQLGRNAVQRKRGYRKRQGIPSETKDTYVYTR